VPWGEAMPAESQTDARSAEYDVVVVGAGFAGLYLLHEFRRLGLSAAALEAADDVGGTWYWNRYPGARCDIESLDYSYSFDRDLDESWTWSEKFATQPEILRYLQHVAERHDLRRDIRFETRVASARWDAGSSRWQLTTDRGDTVVAQHYVMATGCLSVPKEVDIDGVERFGGEVYLTGRWPHDGVDFTGKRVAVIGTGSSAIQSIPVIASQAAAVTVFQRTPNFSIPANNGPVPAAKAATVNADRAAYRFAARRSPGGVPLEVSQVSALAVSDEERQAHYEAAWDRGGIMEFLGCYMDHLANAEANDLLAEFVRNKIRSVVHDPETAELLCPKAHPIGTKRLCVDSNYYATYNLPHVRLVDLRAHPIASVTEQGLDLVDESFEFDILVLATGFDAMTGAVVAVDITGRDGLTLEDQWAGGPTTYLGLMAEGFPNLYMVTGPGSPSVLSNMAVSIEQHVEWIVACIEGLRQDGFDTIEPTPTAVDGWVAHTNALADLTLMPRANSWYMGANVPGKPRVFLPYPGGVERYRVACDEAVDRGWLGFERRGPDGAVCNDGILRRLQPDVMIMLEVMGELGLPTLDSMAPDQAREMSKAMAAQRAQGPDVGEVVDGVLPGAVGELRYRLFRPATPGPHPILTYYHGGGWVLGDETSDDPFCRDLCVRLDAVIVSVDYRHGPEARFPAAVDDALAAVDWVSEHGAELGGNGELAVGGWSAGANLAAVVAQLARDRGGPTLCGQLLLTPVTDGATTHPSHGLDVNGDGYILTASLMEWFWGHYADEAQRNDPRASPLRAASLADLPPAVVISAEFDPLRDEGIAYAKAMAAAGTPVHHIAADGHIHTSITAVDMLPTGAAVREALGTAANNLFSWRAAVIARA
jgi:cation diffusion facilitator CzcD-associated flavoprotein CzcO/acetyl esterase/lipase